MDARSWICSNKGIEPRGRTSKSGSKKEGAGSISALCLSSWAVFSCCTSPAGLQAFGVCRADRLAAYADAVLGL
jgi:hypothetical protein